MNIYQFLISFVVLILGLSSCTKNKAQPNLAVASEFHISLDQLVYQYYQKYGFTDVCENIRMVTSVDVSPRLKNQLPIKADDRMMLSNILKGTATMNETEIRLNSNGRTRYLDIELEFVEFSADTLPVIRLSQGEYEFHQTDLEWTLKVYDSESGLLLIASHRCDE